LDRHRGINAFLVCLSVWVGNNWLDFLGGTIVAENGFWSYFWAAIVISIVSSLLSWFLPSED